MAKGGEYTISDIYQGGYSSLKPSYGDIFVGYRVAASQLGASASIQTANQLQEVNQLLNQGIIPIEIGTMDPRIFDTIPKQHFKEMKQMAKLTGGKISVHAPLIEPSGIDPEQRRPWDESYRELAEKQLKDVVERSIEVDDKGSVPITIHSAGIPGTDYKIEDGKKKIKQLVVINQETGKMAPLEEERLYYPSMIDKKGKPIPVKEGSLRTPEWRLNNLNHTEWDNSVSQLIFNKERADEILQQNKIQVEHLWNDIQTGKINEKILTKSPTTLQAYNHLVNAKKYLDDTQQHIEALFHKAYKYGTDEQKKVLKQISEQYKENLKNDLNPWQQSQALQNLIHGLGHPGLAPDMYVPVEDFALEKSAKTFGNVAFDSYKKFGNKAPVIGIENFHPGTPFAYGEELKNLVEKSRQEFVKKAVEKGYSKSQAEKQAEKMIGVTWDIGHIHLAKKYGFKEKDLIKESKKVAPFVKHVHLTDNFGYDDSHLALGMGDVPIKEHLKVLEKAGTLKDVRKIIESGGWAAQFKASPLLYNLEAMGSPIYSMAMAPYWNQAIALQQGYYGGYGTMLPSGNYQTWGSGFSMAFLPVELGGQMPGAQGSRVSGRPME